jgi:hypothetical protein
MAEQPEFVVNFPTLWVAAAWVEQHCIVPDGFKKGQRFHLVDWQRWALLNFYRLRPDAQPGQLSTAFFFRRSQIVLPQKAGKAPYTAAHICVEAVGPALFAGLAQEGDVYDCAEHGCGCGWVYQYDKGEPMGMRWPTPLIQITATSEDQTDNIYTALRPMIDDGPLHELIPKTGEEFIRLPGDGEIAVVTSNARSRLGNRVTFVAQDETGIWTKATRMIDVAETQRRGLSGMQGRAEETTNAWDPAEKSVAARTCEAAKRLDDIFRWHPQAPKGLKYKVRDERRKIHKFVYAGCHWIDLDAIEGEAAELMEFDPAQAERFYGNNLVAGGGPAFDLEAWEKLAKRRKVPDGALITIGVDGARTDDAVAIVACEIKTGYVWSLDIIERPENLTREQIEVYEHDRDRADGAIRGAFERFNVWRCYCDPHHLDYLIEGWQNDHGAKRVSTWLTNRNKPIAWAVRNFEVAISQGDLTHAGNEVLDRHIANARKRELTELDDDERPMHTLSKDAFQSPRKMDGAMAAVLAWEARGDAIEAGAEILADHQPLPPQPEPQRWEPGTALPAEFLTPAAVVGPMGDLS